MNVCDGKYTGDLTPEQTIEQYKYRAGIHLTYLTLLEEGHTEYLGFGTIEFHYWAINGYEWGIKHIQECNPIRYICSLSEALSTIIRMLLFRR